MTEPDGSWARPPLTSLVDGLATAAKLYPDKVAVHYRVWHPQGKNKEVKVDKWQSCTYAEFWDRVCRLCDNVLKFGAREGDRALVFWIPPSQMDVLALMFALLKAGVVIIWLDPRTLTLAQLLDNIELVQPRIMFADSLVRRIVRFLQVVKGRLRCIRVVIGSRQLNGKGNPKQRAAATEGGCYDADGGVIMFTTGSTGPPKPVRITAACLAGQVDAYESAARNAGLGGPGLLTAVHTGMNFNALDLALGNTTITLPDPANPKLINPKWIEEVDALFRPSVITASRVVYENLARASEARRDQSETYLPNIRLIFSGGAPVTPTLLKRVSEALPNLTDFFSAYGCTEGLPLMLSGWHSTYGSSLDSPVSKQSMHEGYGVALGQRCSHVEVFVLSLDKAEELDAIGKQTKTIQMWNDSWCCAMGEMGELVIRSPSVSPYYVNNEIANATAKFHHPSGGSPMHRTGDLVLQDSHGQYWMMGRVAQAVRIENRALVPPVCIESLFDLSNDVLRCAFVGVPIPEGNGHLPVLIILRTPEARRERIALDESHFRGRIKATERWAFLLEYGLTILDYTDGREFPMDTRHNSKIRREILAEWAARKLSKHLKAKAGGGLPSSISPHVVQ